MTDLQKDVAVYKLGIVKQTVRSQISELESISDAQRITIPEYNILDHADDLGFSVVRDGSITVSHVVGLDGDSVVVTKIERDENA